MNKRKRIMGFFIMIMTSLNISAMEIDQLTYREEYQFNTSDFTQLLNDQTNSLLIKAVDNYNSLYSDTRMTQKEIHSLLAFEIFKITAGKRTDFYGSPIPNDLNLAYAITKSGQGPLQKWIESPENDDYTYQLMENIYSDSIPKHFNKNYIINVGNEFIGPDKIDHFFDQGYSYWIMSEYGQDDLRAREFGVETEYGWYGIQAVGVFSFADLRANWGGYQFYKYLFNGKKSHFLISTDGQVSIRRPFDWKEHIDWQFDELKNPSIYTNASMKKIQKIIDKNYNRYMTTFLYLKEHDFFSWFDKREDFYLIENLDFSNRDVVDVRNMVKDLL